MLPVGPVPEKMFTFAEASKVKLDPVVDVLTFSAVIYQFLDGSFNCGFDIY
jgi:hypothetical protein